MFGNYEKFWVCDNLPGYFRKLVEIVHIKDVCVPILFKVLAVMIIYILDTISLILFLWRLKTLWNALFVMLNIKIIFLSRRQTILLYTIFIIWYVFYQIFPL